MEAQMNAQEMPTTGAKTSSWKMSVLVAIVGAAALFALALYAQNQGWLQQASHKASELIASASPAAAKGVSVEESLVKARDAYANGDVNASIEAYRAIIAKHPEDMAARGELGNVLYAMGNIPEATQLYSEVATIAIEKKQLEIAENLLPVISESNPALANQLSDKLFESQMRADMSQPVPQRESAQQPMPAMESAQHPVPQQPVPQHPGQHS
jgi:tetratricopeptide (TPR) repeat protein